MLVALCGRTTQALGDTVGRCVSTCRPTGLSSLRGHVALGEALLRCVHADPSSPRPPKPARWGAAQPWFSSQAGSCASPPPTPACISAARCAATLHRSVVGSSWIAGATAPVRHPSHVGGQSRYPNLRSEACRDPHAQFPWTH